MTTPVQTPRYSCFVIHSLFWFRHSDLDLDHFFTIVFHQNVQILLVISQTARDNGLHLWALSYSFPLLFDPWGIPYRPGLALRQRIPIYLPSYFFTRHT